MSTELLFEMMKARLDAVHKMLYGPCFLGFVLFPEDRTMLRLPDSQCKAMCPFVAQCMKYLKARWSIIDLYEELRGEILEIIREGEPQ
jgi:hypothetical protein